MKKIFIIFMAFVLMMAVTACGNKNQTDKMDSMVPEGSQQTENEQAGEQEKSIRVASDGAQTQTDDPDMSTRVIENGTPINMHFGKTVIPGVLNDSDTAKALIEKLPYTVHMGSYSHDFCGVMPEELPYKEDEVHFGWLNGDIDYAIDAPYFTILHSDEESSGQYGSQVNIGVISCELAKIRNLRGDYDVRIELAEGGSDSGSKDRLSES